MTLCNKTELNTACTEYMDNVHLTSGEHTLKLEYTLYSPSKGIYICVYAGEAGEYFDDYVVAFSVQSTNGKLHVDFVEDGADLWHLDAPIKSMFPDAVKIG